jgi:hypothetical protein
MTTMTRTDRHRPSAPEFDPEDYEFSGVVHNASPDSVYTNDSFRRTRNALLAQGYTFSGVHGGIGQCDHCGARLRYSALMIHIPTRTLLYVGETCLDNRFEAMTKAEFDRARREAQLDRERQARKTRFAELCAEHQDLAWATYASNIAVVTDETGTRWAERYGKDWAVSVLLDIARKAYQYGSPSEKQLNFVSKLVRELEGAEADAVKREQERAAELAARPNAAIGEVGERRVFEGTVRWSKQYEGDYGTTTVMVIDTPEGTVKWKASKALEFEKNEAVKIKATIKDHEIYDRDQSITTVVTRGTFLD